MLSIIKSTNASEVYQCCAQGQYCGYWSSSNAVQCPDNECSSCPSGKTSNGCGCFGQTSCQFLRATSHCSTVATCPSNTVSSGGTCVANAGYYLQSGTAYACPANSDSAAGSTDVSDCTAFAGYYLQSGTVYACPANSDSAAGSTDVSDCTALAGYYMATVPGTTGWHDVTSICSGTYYPSILDDYRYAGNNDRKSTCLTNYESANYISNCFVVFFVPDEGEYTYYCRFYAGECVDSIGRCPSRYRVTNVYSYTTTPSTTVVTECPVEAPLSLAGATSLGECFAPCTAGSYGLGGSHCTTCPANTDSATASTDISQCTAVAGYYMGIIPGSPAGWSRETCTSFASRYSNGGAYGNYNNVNFVSTMVANCEAEVSSTTRCYTVYENGDSDNEWYSCRFYNTECIVNGQCPSGSYQQHVYSYSTGTAASSGVQQCPSGTTSLPGATSPEECVAPCSAGEYGTGGSSCESCPSGSDSPAATGGTDVSSCVCNAGYAGTLVNEFSTCESCGTLNENTYQDAGACVSCNENAIANKADGATHCLCNAGYYGSTCAACGAGTYKESIGDSACVDCAQYAHSVAASSFCVCISGNYLDGVHTADGTNCVPCGIGTWKGSSDLATTCTDCLDGDTTSASGSTALEDCVCIEGATPDDPEEPTICSLCTVGKYKDVQGPVECTPCPAGSTTTQNQCEGRFTALSCCVADIGYVSSGGSFQLSPTGTYKNVVGNLAAESCPEYSNSPAGSTLLEACSCNAGYAGVDGQTCDECPSGTFEDTSDHLCKSCPENADSPSGSSHVTSCVCAAGFGGHDGAANCVECNTGFYESEDECVSCPSNTISEPASASIIRCLCNAGYTGPDGGECTPCGVNQYKSAIGSTGCQSCSDHTNSPQASTSSANCECNTGYVGSNDNGCTQCEAGKYVGSNLCVSCPSNSNSDAGSDDLAMCYCNAGYTGSDGELCSACEAGKFKSDSGSALCVSCDQNSNTAYSGSTLSTACQCNVGYTGPNGGPCLACEAGKYKNNPGSEVCVDCDANANSPMASTEAAACQCKAGYTGLDGGECTLCSVNQYKSEIGSVTCNSCGEHANSPEASTSIMNCTCNTGYVSIVNSNDLTCTQCGNNTYLEDNYCKICPPNTHSNAGSTDIKQCFCNPGYYYSPLHDKCQVCEANSYCAGGGLSIQSIELCPPNAQSAPGADDYEDCSCIAGYYGINLGFSLNCSQCKSAFYCPGGSDIERCPGNSSSPVSSSKKTDCTCNANYTGPDGGTCANCAAGSYCGGGNATEACPSNSHSPSNSDEVTDCICNAGYTGPDGQACTACGAKHYKSATGSADCIQCTHFSTSPAASIAQTDCRCDAGYIGPPGGQCGFVCPAGSQRTSDNTDCEMCPASKFKPDAGDHACTDCPENALHSLTNQTSVTACFCKWGFIKHSNWPSIAECVNCADTNQFNNYNNEEKCFDCDSNTDGTTCLNLQFAPAGYNYDRFNLALCISNKYNDGTFATCQLCPEGSSHALTGSDSINDCTCHVGYTRLNSGQACEQCVAGTYKDVEGDSACSICPSDSSSAIASDAVGDCHCNAGYTGPNGGTCEACAANTFKASSGPSTCTSCPSNTVSVSGSDDVSDCKCDVGYTGPDGSACTACLEGKYKDKNGTAGCSDCTDYASSPSGSDNIDDCTCNPGYNFDSSKNCVLDCAAGTTGSSGSCVNCAAGTFKSTTGSGVCTQCNVQRNESAAGSVSAHNCTCASGRVGFDTSKVGVVLGIEFPSQDSASISTTIPVSPVHIARLIIRDISQTLANLKVYLERDGISLLIFACEDNDCGDEEALDFASFHAVYGRLIVHGTVNLQIHTMTTDVLFTNSMHRSLGPETRVSPGMVFFSELSPQRRTDLPCTACPAGLICA